MNATGLVHLSLLYSISRSNLVVSHDIPYERVKRSKSRDAIADRDGQADIAAYTGAMKWLFSA